MNKGLFLALLASVAIVGCGKGADDANSSSTMSTNDSGNKPVASGETKTIAFVTNNPSDYWLAAKAGTEKAATELKGYKVEFKMAPDGNVASQKQILDDLVVNGVKGIAVSPTDPVGEKGDLDKIVDKGILLICQDSDAADSKRAAYIGTDNVAAGVMAGEEVKKALPNGGKIMVFVGKADAQNAKERYEGLKKALAGSKVEVLDLRTDDTDRARAKQNVSDAIVKYPDLAGCVGLWSYNGPAIINAVKEAKKVGKIQVVTFDDEADTITGVQDGSIFSMIVQQPFQFGYESMMMMAKVIDGDKSALPKDGKKIIPTQAINKDSVKAYLDSKPKK